MQVQKINSSTPRFGMRVNVNEERLGELSSRVVRIAQEIAEEQISNPVHSIVCITRGSKVDSFGCRKYTKNVVVYAMAIEDLEPTELELSRFIGKRSKFLRFIAKYKTKEGIEHAMSDALIDSFTAKSKELI